MVHPDLGQVPWVVPDGDRLPHIAGTRISVTTILGLLWEGMSAAEVLANYPQLVNDDVHACVQYAARAGDRQGFGQRTLPPGDE